VSSGSGRQWGCCITRSRLKPHPNVQKVRPVIAPLLNSAEVAHASFGARRDFGDFGVLEFWRVPAASAEKHGSDLLSADRWQWRSMIAASRSPGCN
jgi:hypothetical protein